MIDWNKVLEFASGDLPEADRRVEKTPEEWKEILTEEEFRISRQKGTERPFSSGMCSAFEAGIYNCTCCDTALFDSTVKYESRSGWPSFNQPIKENVVGYHLDDELRMTRIEIVCNVCDAHLGHVFPDGPEPSGLRYCVNAISLKKQ